MPVHIKTIKVEPVPCRTGQGLMFDHSVAQLAPAINRFRAIGIQDIRRMMKYLNNEGVLAPNGGAFTFGTMRRVWRRLAELDLGPGPRTPTDAANKRAPRSDMGKGRPRRPSRTTKTTDGETLRLQERMRKFRLPEPNAERQ